MRVFFADVDGLSVFHDSRASQEEVYDRFKGVLKRASSSPGDATSFWGSHMPL
jgi:hypothetical protein